MSRTSQQQTVVDVTYNDPRTKERVRERRVQEIPWDAVDDVRNRELALVRRAPDDRDDRDHGYDDDRYADDRYALQRRRETDEDVVPYRRREESSRRPPPRRDQRHYDDESESDNSESSREERRRRRRRRGDRSRAGGSRAGGSRADGDDNRDGIKPTQEQRLLKQEEDEQGRLWYSLKNREEGNWAERNFDSSYDGLIAAAAGAAIGAITVRNFEKEDDDTKTKVIKTLGGAALGAAAFNAGENWYRVFTEERDERKGKKEVANQSQKVQEQGGTPRQR